MTLSTYIAAVVVIAIIAAVVIAFVMGVRRELDHVDEWWQPSESGRLAKLEYDTKQAAKKADEQSRRIVRRINKPTYQQPTENS